MHMIDRRHFLATAGILSTAGCTILSDSTDTPRPGPGDYHTYDKPMFQKTGRVTIPESDHEAFNFESDQRMKLDYSAFVFGDDKTMDVFVLSRREYEEYAQGSSSFSHIPGETVFGVDGAEEGGYMDPGGYTIVFDNTDEAT